MRSFAIKMFVAVMAVAALTSLATAQADTISFDLHVDPAIVSCLSADGGPTPTAHVTVKRGKFNDTLTIEGNNFRPHLAFDMFTVQRSKFLANGNADPNFHGSFGLAWYQSDLQASALGHFKTTVKTILLDQIFGFDPDVALAPTNTFHVGFWFNNPADAAQNGCNFDVTKATPFNGEHKAGPLAMISLPEADSKLGPLCTNPNNDGTCNP